MSSPYRNAAHRSSRSRRIGACLAVALACLVSMAHGQVADPGVHYLHSDQSPPGAIGNWQLARDERIRGYFQPVEIRAPEGALISLAVGGGFDNFQESPRLVGLAVGNAYRFQVSSIPLHEGEDVYPSVEVLDRLHPPPGLETLYPIPVQLTQEDLELALAGHFVIRVIYVEDPATAMPVQDDPREQRWLDVRAGENALQVADEFGRPVAILRVGGRVPPGEGPDDAFLLGAPPFAELSRAHEARPLFRSAVEAISARRAGGADRFPFRGALHGRGGTR